MASGEACLKTLPGGRNTYTVDKGHLKFQIHTALLIASSF